MRPRHGRGGFRVEPVDGFVQDQDGRVGEQRAGQEQPPALAARHRGAVPAEQGVPPVGQRLDPVQEPGPVGGFAQVGVRGSGAGQRRAGTETRVPVAWVHVDAPECHRVLTLVWNRDAYLSEAALKFREFTTSRPFMTHRLPAPHHERAHEPAQRAGHTSVEVPLGTSVMRGAVCHDIDGIACPVRRPRAVRHLPRLPGRAVARRPGAGGAERGRHARLHRLPAAGQRSSLLTWLPARRTRSRTPPSR